MRNNLPVRQYLKRVHGEEKARVIIDQIYDRLVDRYIETRIPDQEVIKKDFRDELNRAVMSTLN